MTDRPNARITDEFPEFTALTADVNSADRERVIEAVMHRIQPDVPVRGVDGLLAAIALTGWPVLGIGGVAALALLAVLLLPEPVPSVTRATPAPAPSTAQALGMPLGIARWTEQRERTPQLLEVARDLSPRAP